MVTIPGYKFERLDRNGCNGGGVGCYVKDKHTYVRRSDLESTDLELLWLEVKRVNSSSLFIGIVYRKPDANTSFFNTLEENIDRVMAVSNNVMILGDFNCNMITNNSLSKKVNELCSFTQMEQIVKEPTRVTPHSSSLIDLILTSSTISTVQSGVQCIGFSDHSLVFTVLKGKCQTFSPKISKIRSFRSFDEVKFKKDLSELDWSEIHSNDCSVQRMWDCFKSKIQSLCDKHAPFISVRRKCNGVPWITDEYIKVACERDFYRKKYKSSNLTSDWDKFKLYRNRANNLNKRLKKEYFENEFIQCGNDVNKNWKILKNLIPSKCSNTDYKIIINGDIITDSSKIVNILNETFNDVSERLKDSTSTRNSDCNPDVNTMNTLFKSNKEFKFKEIPVDFVKSELLSIDCKKATGMDGLHPKLLKLAADYISEPLTFIFNCSLKTSHIPMDFKMARVTPIHKGGSYEVNNFRPISVLPVLSKILEKAVHKQLYAYLNENGMLSSQQSGFRPSHSTATCITDIVDYLLSNMNTKQITGSIFLDLKKAFDVISHDKILNKLFYYGIRNKEHCWFFNYLVGRKQCVSMYQCTSDFVTIKSGVPQGSILGPLLFCLYINDLCNLDFHPNTKISLYADDTAVFSHGYDVLQVQEILQKDFDLIVKWLENNDMYLHPSKTKIMLFGPKKKIQNKQPVIKFYNTALEQVDKTKYLGLIFDSQLLWNDHILYIHSKISRSIGCIRRVKHLIPKKILINLYYAFILPHIDYCCTAWGSCSKMNLAKIQRLQNKYARLVLNADSFTSQCYLTTTLNWQSVEQRIKFQYCLLVFKILKNMVPPYLKRLISPYSQTYCTRYSENNTLSIPHPKSDYKKRSFSFTASSLFNKLPISVQLSHTIHTFKTGCLKFSFML